MAIENSPYIGGLNGSIPANTDPRAEGAAQIRAVKTALKNTFPNLDGIVNANTAKVNKVLDAPELPKGLIAMWNSDVLPEGWVEADGSIKNGYQTPDLRGVFPRGSDTNTPIGDTGGQDNPNISDSINVDDHVLSVAELPEHDHDYIDRYYPEDKDYLTGAGANNVMNNDGGNQVGSGETDSDDNGLLFKDTKTEKSGSNIGHNHSLSDNTTTPFDNRPSFYSLMFICYVGIID